MLNLVVAAAFQNIDEPNDIAVDVSMRVLQGIAHTGLSREIDDFLRLMFLKCRVHAWAVGNIESKVGKISMVFDSGQSVDFKTDFVIVVQIVDTNNFIAPLQQA